jgi:hypothetical protein
MKGRELIKPRFQMGLSLALIAIAMCLLSNSLVAGDDAKPAKAAAPSKKADKKSRKKLSGAELYAIHCNRCHPERYATERTEAQWKTILLHMRTRANLPAEQAREIQKFLQEDSGK